MIDFTWKLIMVKKRCIYVPSGQEWTVVGSYYVSLTKWELCM